MTRTPQDLPSEEPFDLITMGRVGVDLYPGQLATSLADVTTFRKMLGGSPTNVAVAAARLGLRSAVITKVGADAFGVFVRQALDAFGVDSAWVTQHHELRTPLTFCEIFPPDHFPLLFYRQPTAPDMTLSVEDLPLTEIATARILWTTGTGLADEPSRTATLAALQARPANAITIHDLDFRPSLWPNPAEAGRWGRLALEKATIAIGNREEVATVVGDRPAEEAARALLDLGVDLAVVKLGERGVLAASHHQTVIVPPTPVKTLNGLGAGDAFGGAFCHGRLAGWPLEQLLGFANAAGALVASRLGCADDMPTETEVHRQLSDHAPHARNSGDPAAARM
ncbi:5-dehydro-2-deoxygluconokinase [Nonomuraea sp. NPDC026600]|uniref:5-dehydro-2-deoxygluconokinase n=1 Tax=Nonomuraea sp. NPDC026600 TaxID=3155363 RepID=UPI0033C966D3